MDLKIFRDLVLVFKCNNEIRLKGFYSYLMKFMSYELLFDEKQTLFFFKSPLQLEKKLKMLKFSKNILISDLYKGKNFNGKKLVKLMHCCYLTTKTISRLQKKRKGNGPKMDFQTCRFLVYLTMHLPKHMCSQEIELFFSTPFTLGSFVLIISNSNGGLYMTLRCQVKSYLKHPWLKWWKNECTLF